MPLPTLSGLFDRITARMHRWPVTLQGAVFFGALGAVLVTLAILVAAIGQSVAIGPTAALHLFWRSYVRIALVVPLWCFGLGLLMGGLIFVIEKIHEPGHPILVRAIPVVFSICFVSAVVGLIAWASYTTARDRYRDLSVVAPTGASLDSALGKQQSLLESASSSAQSILRDLDVTEGEIAKAKAQLRATLLALEQQQSAMQSSTAAVKEIDDRQATLRLQIAAVQSALGGQEPITRADLERSNWYGQIQGFILGVVSSVVASYVVVYLNKAGLRWRRRPE
jgi:hypothetical protein